MLNLVKMLIILNSYQLLLLQITDKKVPISHSHTPVKCTNKWMLHQYVYSLLPLVSGKERSRVPSGDLSREVKAAAPQLSGFPSFTKTTPPQQSTLPSLLNRLQPESAVKQNAQE